MPGVTAEQIEQAKRWDLLSYLQAQEPQELKRSGPHEYRTVTHDSLVISNGKWHWCSRGLGGTTALDYLIKVRDMPFVEAVQTLCDGRAAPFLPQPVKRPPEPTKPFVLPAPNADSRRAIAYLCSRGIDPEIIRLCVQAGILYESRKHHNCVFVGRDKAGTARFACMRGTMGDFKLDVEGSDKRFGFCLSSCAPPSRFVAVFESPIDAISYATLRKMETNAWDRYHYLSLGGTSPLALLEYLKGHPEADHVYMYLDNDKAGLDGMAKIRAAIYADETLDTRVKMITAEPPPRECGKDYNQVLQKRLAQSRPPKKCERSISR
jgi:hypothetical protein